jgi:selenocysteine lyase/cysteine desulfurase
VDSPSYDLEEIRSRIPILGHAIPMNNCSQAPLCDVTRAAAEDFLASWESRGMDWERWIHEVELAKREFAGLINAGPDEVAAVTSVSHATSVIATAIDLGGHRNTVVAAAGEFPTVGHVWLAQERSGTGKGACVSWVPVRDGALAVEDYARLITERTAIVSATHAYYVNGFVQDIAAIARIAHGHGALVFVDAYQSLGTMPVDVKAIGVDFLAAGTLKFLMGTPGIAFLYARRELIDGLHPTFTGWFGRENPFAFDTTRLDWSPTASRLEAGTPSIFSAYVSRAGMSLVKETGLEAIGHWNGLLSRRLVEGGRALGLTIHGPGLSQPKTPTTAFVCRRDSRAVEEGLRRRGVIASARGSVIRLAPHFYSSFDDVDAALEAVAAELPS